MKTPSSEQLCIIDAIATSNVIIDSVAGSGKTTTILHIAARYRSNILVLTYNARLKFETRERAEALGLDIDVYTYHAFAYRFIANTCYTDVEIIKFIESGADLDCSVYDIIIIDEAQDMTETYYRLAQKIIAKSPKARLAIFGDKFQNIYRFARADCRFIIMADLLYKNAFPWARHSLNTSYRLTRQNAAFVNCILGIDRLHAVKDGPKPRYVIFDAFNRMTEIINEIINLRRSGECENEDIFVLAPSVRSRPALDNNEAAHRRESPIKILANELSKLNKRTDIEEGKPYLVYLPTSDEQRLDEDLMKNKIVFSSFHQSKGLERKHVIIVGFDESYAKFYNRDESNDICSNAMYVALTRSTHTMTIYHHYEQLPLPYVFMDKIKHLAEVIGPEPLRRADTKDKMRSLSVSELCRQLSPDVIIDCMKYVNAKVLRRETPIQIPCKSEQTTKPDANGNTVAYYEEVATINGAAITMYCEWLYLDQITVYDNGYRTVKPLASRQVKRVSWRDIYDQPTIPEILYVANHSLANRDGLYYRCMQVREYNWLSNAKFYRLFDRLVNEINYHNPAFEVELSGEVMNKTICGAADIIVQDRLYEIKTVSELAPEHYLQLALYMFCIKQSYAHHPYATQSTFRDVRHYLLYNVRGDELIELDMDLPALEAIATRLVCNKIHPKATQSDADFLREMTNDHAPLVHKCTYCKEFAEQLEKKTEADSK